MFASNVKTNMIEQKGDMECCPSTGVSEDLLEMDRCLFSQSSKQQTANSKQQTANNNCC